MDRIFNHLELPITMPLSFGIVGNSSYSSLITSKNLPLPDLIVEHINAKAWAAGKKASLVFLPSPTCPTRKNFQLVTGLSEEIRMACHAEKDMHTPPSVFDSAHMVSRFYLTFRSRALPPSISVLEILQGVVPLVSYNRSNHALNCEFLDDLLNLVSV